MNLLRWVILLPAGVAAAIVAHIVGVTGLAIGHGFRESLAFWDASDMNNWWVSGTITLVMSRGASGAFSTWVVFQIAPSYKLGATRVWIGLLAAITALVLYMIIDAISILPHSPFSFGHWYRYLVEMGALLGGAFLVYADLKTDPSVSHSP